MKSVLVLGGYGGFGTRLCLRLAEDGWHVLVAGRNLAKAKTLASQLPGASGIAVDRTIDLASVLTEHEPELVIDAAGPFQGSDYRVAEACIAHRTPYLDLADGRDFVNGIGTLDAAAQAAGVAIISGASSVPALSGAVVRKLAEGLDEVTQVKVAISASDKAVAGTSVATAILSYVGKPVRLWRGGRWVLRHGWQDQDELELHIHRGKRFARRVALADVPDLDIWPEVLPGRPATLFRAGPEFGFQVRALGLLAWLVRWRLLSSLTPLSRLLLPLQSLTRRFSDGRSAMVVQLCGRCGDVFEKRRWELLASDGDGPEIPVLAAQLLARRIAEGAVVPGARDAHGGLPLADFEPEFARLSIECATASEAYVPLYRRVLGEDYDRLPDPLQAMHDLCGDGGASGEARVTRGDNPLARVIAAIMRFPEPGEHLLHVTFVEHEGRETWVRDFSGQRFHSELSEWDGRLSERFGPMHFGFDLPVSEEGLGMRIVRWSLFGVPMPLWLAPRVAASEVVVDGKFAFDVEIALPIVGRLVRYKGSLLKSNPPSAPLPA